MCRCCWYLSRVRIGIERVMRLSVGLRSSITARRAELLLVRLDVSLWNGGKKFSRNFALFFGVFVQTFLCQKITQTQLFLFMA